MIQHASVDVIMKIAITDHGPLSYNFLFLILLWEPSSKPSLYFVCFHVLEWNDGDVHEPIRLPKLIPLGSVAGSWRQTSSVCNISGNRLDTFLLLAALGYTLPWLIFQALKIPFPFKKKHSTVIMIWNTVIVIISYLWKAACLASLSGLAFKEHLLFVQTITTHGFTILETCNT
jgi:hypothetical protein